MAVKNSLTQKKTQIFQNIQTAVYEVGGQKVELTPEVIREYMVSAADLLIFVVAALSA